MNLSYVYILASQRNGTLYVGVTSDLIRRVYQHKNVGSEGFSKKYKTNRLVYFESHCSIEEAIKREKTLKRWWRCWKIALIEEGNPYWQDLYAQIVG